VLAPEACFNKLPHRRSFKTRKDVQNPKKESASGGGISGPGLLRVIRVVIGQERPSVHFRSAPKADAKSGHQLLSRRARKSHLNNSKLLISSTIEPERLSAAFFDRLVHPYQRRQATTQGLAQGGL
jgi:hypothetical protein